MWLSASLHAGKLRAFTLPVPACDLTSALAIMRAHTAVTLGLGEHHFIEIFKNSNLIFDEIVLIWIYHTHSQWGGLLRVNDLDVPSS